MTKLSRRGFLGSLAGSSAGFLTAVTLPKAAFAADQAPQNGTRRLTYSSSAPEVQV